jgi:hypothetical protein
MKKHGKVLNLSTRWRWVVRFTSQLLYPKGRSPQYPLDKEWVGLRASLETEKKKALGPLLGIKPQFHGSPAHTPSLNWLNYPRHMSLKNTLLTNLEIMLEYWFINYLCTEKMKRLHFCFTSWMSMYCKGGNNRRMEKTA